MKNRQKRLNITAGVLAGLLAVVVLWGLIFRADPLQMQVSDGIEQIDLDTIYLRSSGVEVSFSDVILSGQNETRKLIVSTQTSTVSTKLTDRLIKQLDFDFMKKTQNVLYTGTGYFVVDLDNLTAANVVEDHEEKTVTIFVDHPYLQTIEIDPSRIIIEDVEESLLARGDIKLSVADYTAIEEDLRSRMEKELDTAANGQTTDALAVKMVKQVYEPIVKAIDRRYSVVVELK
nr:DUF4230 domain-containing protein [uncultured Oscillibacter sp.]